MTAERDSFDTMREEIMHMQRWFHENFDDTRKTDEHIQRAIEALTQARGALDNLFVLNSRFKPTNPYTPRHKSS